MDDRLVGIMSNRLHAAQAKKDEERRLVLGFIERMALPAPRVEEAERPDFFLHFGIGSEAVTIGCELTRFDRRSSAKSFEELARWKRFAEKLREALFTAGLEHIYGAVFFRDPVHDNLAKFLRIDDEAVSGMLTLARAFAERGVAKGTGFIDPTVCPPLVDLVEHVFFRHETGQTRLWWCAHLQSGRLPDTLGTLERIVEEKSVAAVGYDWRNAAERWLAITAEAHGLDDTLALRDPTGFEFVPGDTISFTRILIWDGFFEKISELWPTCGIVTDAADGLVYVRRFPPILQPFLVNGGKGASSPSSSAKGNR